MLLWLVLLFLIVGIVMFIHKLIYKGAMQKKLGRKVDDRELTSISAWMDDKPGTNKTENQ